jgi:hypothetical protein
MKLYMFRTVPLSIIRSFSLYTQQWYISYRFADSLRAGLYDPAHKLYTVHTTMVYILQFMLTACEQDYMLLLTSCTLYTLQL